TYKGLRQGDPLSPILFNIGQFEGLIPHLLSNSDWKTIEINLVMFMLFFWQGDHHKKKYRLAHQFFGLGSFILKDGKQIRFWEDTDTVANIGLEEVKNILLEAFILVFWSNFMLGYLDKL
ncbi:hypothetical protein ACJX0J_039082, partial [Zea mays]